MYSIQMDMSVQVSTVSIKIVRTKWTHELWVYNDV